MYVPLNILGTMWRFIRSAMVDVELVLELLDINEKILDPVNPIVPHIKEGEIEFRNVSFTYDKKVTNIEDRKMIIDNLSFKVPKGKSVAIVGSTGSGKSTIMRLLYRFYDIEEG
jgi:ATP-binding cassette, subfamily B, heavy metal transporter